MTAPTAPPLASDIRFTSGICTPNGVGALCSMPSPTVRNWMRASRGRAPLVHSVHARRGWPTVPLIGLVEAWSMRALRSAGVPMQRLAKTAYQLQENRGDPYVLARPILFTDGIDLYLRASGALCRVGDGQMPIDSVIERYLHRIELDDSDTPTAFRIELDDGVEATIDPRFNAGRPSLSGSRVPVFALLGALAASTPSVVVADDYGIEAAEVAAVERNAYWLEKVA